MKNGTIFSLSDYRYQVKKNIFKVPVLFARDIKCCWQRIHKGYCDRDLWSIYDWFLALMPEMLKEYKEVRHGSPVCIEQGEDLKGWSKEISELNQSEWNKIVDQMIFLFREANEYTCQKKNPYEEENDRIYDEFENKYGVFGEKLNQEEKGHWRTLHFPSDMPEYKEMEELYWKEEMKLQEYREECKNQAFELFSRWFYCLWD